MSSRNHSRARICEKNWGTVRRQSADHDTRCARNQRIRTRDLQGIERAIDDERLGAVDLVEGQHLLAWSTQASGDARAILADEARIVLGAQAAIEATVEASGNATLPREKAVADTCDVAEAIRANNRPVHSHSCPSLTRPAGMAAAQERRSA